MRDRKRILVVAAALLAMCGRDSLSLALERPRQLSRATAVTLAKGDLTVLLVDNEPWGREHRRGYNGIAELYHTAQGSSPFVARNSGFNLEHIFGGDRLQQPMEPRRHPMELFAVNRDEALLYQPPTPLSAVESLTRFKLKMPHSIDVTFHCVVHAGDFFRHGYAGLFWASYIDRPADKRIYFRGKRAGRSAERWIAAYSEKHGHESTHRGEHDKFEAYFAPDFNARLANHFSQYRYTRPYYYGRFRNMVLAFMFDTSELIRFSQSPDGGGKGNPAWDFQFLISNLKYGKEYSFRSRVIYKPFRSPEDIEEEYRRWKVELDRR